MENKKHIFGNLYFTHGDNWYGKHTDWIVEMQADVITKFVRKPTLEEKEKYCKE